MIDYYERLMAAQQQAPQGSRWFFDPATEAQWVPAEQPLYVPAPEPVPLYTPQTPARQASAYTPTAMPTPAYNGLTEQDVVAAIEEIAATAPVQQPQAQILPQSSGGDSNYTASAPTPVYDAPQGPANVIGYTSPGSPTQLNGYDGAGQQWGPNHGLYSGNSGGSGLAYGGTDQPFTSNANSSSNPYTGGGGGWSLW
jgi:hypothetical protein